MAEAAIKQAQQLFGELLEDKLLPTEEVVSHLARLARLCDSPVFALWVKEQIDTYKIGVQMSTLQTLLHSFGVKVQYKEPANEILQRLIAMDKHGPRRGGSDNRGYREDDFDDHEDAHGSKKIRQGEVFVDPEEEFDFTRVESRRRL